MYKKTCTVIFLLLFFDLSISIAGNSKELANSYFSIQLSNNIIPISDLHNNDTNGVPFLLGQIVTVSGEVTVTDQFGITAHIEDETAGVAVYDANFATTVNIGDYVTISGRVDQFNGLTELKDVNIIERITKTPSVEPQIITCHDIATEGFGGTEKFEGSLVRINDVTVNTDKWNVSGSGANFILTDVTGSCEIRIDKDTDIANTLAPNSSFDVIGVISQYDRYSPYTEGYQLMPRFNEDIILLSGPRLISGPEEKDITPYSIAVTWSTATPANSIIMYGKTNNYEIDSLTIQESVTQHEITLTGLSSATVYHLKVGSRDDTGTNYSSDHIVSTASDPSSTGEINVYFNKSVDHSLASSGNEANGQQDLATKFINRIDSANYSIDLCFFSWNLKNITDAIIAAYNRRVRIRFIYDSDHNQYQVNRLKQAGITVIDNAFGNNDGAERQHNKFAIFDARDDTHASDDWVWTGSLNFIDYDELGINAAQNVIEIQDQALAKAYTLEFNEMWGSANNTPDATLSRFGPRKLDNTPHKFIINDDNVEMYMCPSDQVTSKIINAVTSADYEIYFCILEFTRYDLEYAMHTQFLTIEGFQIRGLFDSEPDSSSRWYPMQGTGDYAWDPPADVWLENEPGVLHHKYMIIDALHPNSDPIVITGSQNWSSRAENENDENTLIIHDADIANQYLQEFASRYYAAGGTGLFTIGVNKGNQPTTPGSFTLYQNYPNPFNAETIIRFIIHHPDRVSLEVFDINGRLIKTLINRFLKPQKYMVRYSAIDLPSGIYLYQLKNGLKSFVKKMVLVH